jgi:hypothetical protein
MPLESGKGKEAFSHNVAAEMNAGKPQKQAVAIAYAKQREGDGIDPEMARSTVDAIKGLIKILDGIK